MGISLYSKGPPFVSKTTPFCIFGISGAVASALICIVERGTIQGLALIGMVLKVAKTDSIDFCSCV